MAATKEHSMGTTTEDPAAPAKEANEYLTGFKLFVSVMSLTCVTFLMLLDVSVVSTVSLDFGIFPNWVTSLTTTSAGHTKNHLRLPFVG